MARLQSAAMVVLVAATPVCAQVVLNPVRIAPALLDFDRHPNDVFLRCDVTPGRPTLNFGFRFQAGFAVRVPISQFEGPGHNMAFIARVTPEGGKPVYLGERMRLPNIPAGNKNDWNIGGVYLLGEGRYHVTWKLVDDRGRVCRKEWNVEARLHHGESAVRVALAPNTVTDLALRGVPAATHAKDDAPPIRLTVFLHATPVSPRRMRLGPRDLGTLLGALATLLERVPARSTRLVIFNLEQQKELFRQNDFQTTQMDRAARAMSQLELGLVDYHVLQNRTGHLDLLADLVNHELQEPEASDVVLFLGPLGRSYDKVPHDELVQPARAAPRFFYFQYRSPFQMESVLPDTIQRTVSQLKGKVLLIRTPAELAKGIEQIESVKN
jgi:hypothetical protein